MEKVNIYLKTNNHSIKRTERTGMYLLSFTKKDGTLVTYPPIQRIKESIITNASTWIETEAELLGKALACISRPCEITVFSECAQTGILLNLWIPGWKERGWKKSDGEPVNEIYKTLAEVAEQHQITVNEDQHEFGSWMETQMKGEQK